MLLLPSSLCLPLGHFRCKLGVMGRFYSLRATTIKTGFYDPAERKTDIRHCAIDDRPNDYHDWLLEVLTGLYCCATESETKSFFRTGSQFSMQSQRTPSGGSNVIQRWSISAAEQSPRQGDRAPWTCALQRASLIPPDAFELQEMKSREAAA